MVNSFKTSDTQSLFNSHTRPAPTRWLITGGCGFIGRNLINHLIQDNGHYIRIIDNLSVGSREDLSQVCSFTEINPSRLTSGSLQKSKVELIPGDIIDSDLALKVSQNIDKVIHLAANTGVGPSVENPRLDCETNVIGTFNYLEAARQNKVQRFIFASSGAPVGECTPPIHEELAPHPVSPYGASKLAGEAYCSAYNKTFKVETVALRFGNVYGPLSTNKSSVIAKFIKQALRGETCEIYGDGTQTRDFIYIDDLIQAIYKTATLPSTDTQSSLTNTSLHLIAGEVFQIATSKEHTVKEVSDKIKSQLKKLHNIDMNLNYTQPRLGDVIRNFSDTSKAKKILNWHAAISLDEGLKRTVNWFIEQSQPSLKATKALIK